MPQMFPRANHALVTEALADTRVVLLMGARQVGKSTLAQRIVSSDYPASVVNLDERPELWQRLALVDALRSNDSARIAQLAAKLLRERMGL